jgi:acyl-CoA hydrolase
LSDCAHFVRSAAPLATYDAGAVNSSSAQIAANIAEIIPDGASIQIGLGKVPSQLLLALRSHRNLGIHGGMLSDSIVELAEAGALAPDQPLITGIIVGLESFYARAAAMADLQLAPVSHTHNPQVLAGVSRLHSVNSAIEVDLVGQVNAEMQSGKYVSGPGGGPDFAAAAHRQQDGLSIIALPATDSSGRVSRIVAQFTVGTPVAIPQHDVDVVVTEHGVAMLRGQDLNSRIKRLIAVAHPDHRSRLAEQSRRL